ncbi:hypothetical protein SUGI_0385780 [Cryptomeria japonica]|nr:hypothetical protein SUGI_0385780 [Cryptomeria japonica]
MKNHKLNHREKAEEARQREAGDGEEVQRRGVINSCEENLAAKKRQRRGATMSPFSVSMCFHPCYEAEKRRQHRNEKRQRRGGGNTNMRKAEFFLLLPGGLQVDRLTHPGILIVLQTLHGGATGDREVS